MDGDKGRCVLNIELLLVQLKGIFSGADNNFPESQLVLNKIEIILGDRAASLEERIDRLEAYLIEAIYHVAIPRQNYLYKLALKTVHHNRGLYTDDLGKLEKILLMLGLDNAPVNLRANRRLSLGDDRANWRTALGDKFINKISVKISECNDQPNSPAAKIHYLMRLLKGWAKKHKGLNLDYINLCLAKVREYKIITSTIEHSIWAEASLATLHRLKVLNAANKKLPLKGTVTMAKAAYLEQVAIQKERAHYYTQQSENLLEPIGYYVEDCVKNLVTAVTLPNAVIAINNTQPLENLETLKIRTITQDRQGHTNDIDCFSMSHHIITQHNVNQQTFGLLLGFAHRLKKSNNPFGTCIKLIATIMATDLTEDLCSYYFSKLQDLVVPLQWRQKTAELWLSLSEHFHRHFTQDRVFYKKYALTYARLITEKYGAKAHLMAKLQAAKITKNDVSIQTYSEQLQQLCQMETCEAHAPGDEGYSKQMQYLLVKYLIDRDSESPSYAAAIDTQSDIDSTTQQLLEQREVDKYINLMTEKYPHGIEIAIQHLLNKDSRANSAVCRAVRLLYGEKFLNPLKLCELLDDQAFNRHLIIWGPIYCQAITNNLQPTAIKAWRDLGFNDIAINFKLYTYVRSLLYAEITGEKMLVPDSHDYLLELDTCLITISLELIDEIKKDIHSKFFAFARNSPGLLEALLGELALAEYNYPLVEQLAKKSILFCTDHVISPRKSALVIMSPRQAPELMAQESPRKSVSAQQLLSPPTTRSRSSSFSRRGGTQIPVAEEQSEETISPSALGSSMKKIGLLGRRGSVIRSASANISDNQLGEKYSQSPPKASSAPPSSFKLLGKNGDTLPNNQESKTVPSFLGYFLYALVIWHTKLKDVNVRSLADIKEFKKALNDARSSRENEQEHYYIKARIWLMYQETKRDKLWISEDDLQQLEDDLHKFKATTYGQSGTFRSDENRFDYLIIKQAKSKLKRALQHNMFPPASLTLAKDIYYWQTFYYDKDPEKLAEYLAETVGYLEEAIGTHGYNPSLYYYALLIRGNLDYFRNVGSIAFLLEKIKLYLDGAELFIYIDPGQKRDLLESISTAKKIEEDVKLIGELLNQTNYLHYEISMREFAYEFDHADKISLRRRIEEVLDRIFSPKNELIRRWYTDKIGYKMTGEELNKKILGIRRSIGSEFDVAAEETTKPLRERIFCKLERELTPLSCALLRNMPSNCDVAKSMTLSKGFSRNGFRLLNARESAFPKEISRPIHPNFFSELPLKIKKSHNIFKIRYQSAVTNNTIGIEIKCSERYISDLDLFEHYLQLAARFYRYSKGVAFAEDKPIVSKVKNCLLVTHADIIIIAMMKMLREHKKKSDPKIADLQVFPLLEFIRAAATIPAEEWQWVGTKGHLEFIQGAPTIPAEEWHRVGTQGHLAIFVNDFVGYELEITKSLAHKIVRPSQDKESRSLTDSPEIVARKGTYGSRISSRRNSIVEPTPSLLGSDKIPSPRSSLLVGQTIGARRSISSLLSPVPGTQDPPNSPRRAASSTLNSSGSIVAIPGSPSNSTMNK
jgi:hypothetical protein